MARRSDGWTWYIWGVGNTLYNLQVYSVTHCTFQSRRFILSREGHGKLELVDLESLELLVLPAERKGELSEIKQISLDVLPKLEHFPARPVSFLTELRLRREEYLRNYKLQKRNKKVDKSSGTKAPRTVRPGKVSKKLDESLNKLSPELQALVAGALKR